MPDDRSKDEPRNSIVSMLPNKSLFIGSLAWEISNGKSEIGHSVNDSHFGFKAGMRSGCVVGSVRVCAVNQGDGSASHT